MRYGWRARIGHIAPAILDTSGEEMRKLLPAGVLHVGLTISEPIQTLGAEQAAAAFGRMVDAGKRLAAEKVDVLICGGAPVALSKGPAGDAELAELLRQETQLPVVTANGAVVDGLRTLGCAHCDRRQSVYRCAESGDQKLSRSERLHSGGDQRAWPHQEYRLCQSIS